MDFGVHKMVRTTSALSCKRAHFRVKERTLKKCSFQIFGFVFLSTALALTWLVCCAFAMYMHDSKSIRCPPKHLWFNCSAFGVNMGDRLHSANTLEEGMTKVGFGDVQTRKRELEAKILVP